MVEYVITIGGRILIKDIKLMILNLLMIKFQQSEKSEYLISAFL